MDMMNSFALSRNFWDYAFENTGKIKPIHIAIYFFAMEHCNRLGWKKNFGLPTSMVLEAISIKSYSVYKSAFDDLVKFGLIEVIQYSKNQYSSNIIALKQNFNANSKALDKAFIKHASKHMSEQDRSTVQSTGESNVSIDKPINQLTNIPINNITSETDFLSKSLSDEFYKNPEQAFEEIKNDELQMEKLLLIVHRSGFRTCTYFTLTLAIRNFITIESAKPDFTNRPRSELKQHLVNWINKNAKDLQKYAA